MITWMQRHKKWLVITIWISTIAFVGAGFVGWGSYDFGKSQGAIAKVGNKEIGLNEFQNEYSNLYNQYSQIFGDQFNQEVAKKLNLEEIAFNSIVQKGLLLNFADEIGLDVTDTEIAKELLKIPSFQKDGKFDKKIYVQVLSQNRTNPVEFEDNLKRDLLVQKVKSLFDVEVTENEIKGFSELYSMQDDINIEILEAKSILVPNDETKIKAYYEKNKNNYMSNAAYELEIYNHPISSNNYSNDKLKIYYEENKIDFKKLDGKIKTFNESTDDVKSALDAKKSKKDALKKYLQLKKGEIEFTKKEKIFENEFRFSFDDIRNIKSASNGEVLKPFENGKNYTIVKLVSKISPEPIAFEKVKTDVIKSYRMQERKNLILSQAQDKLKIFKGVTVKNVSPEYEKTILSLNENETQNFIKQLFSSSKKEGYINLGEKVVLYRINNSIIIPSDNSNKKEIKGLLLKTKSNELLQNLMDKLQSKYKVISYMNKGE